MSQGLLAELRVVFLACAVLGALAAAAPPATAQIPVLIDPPPEGPDIWRARASRIIEAANAGAFFTVESSDDGHSVWVEHTRSGLSCTAESLTNIEVPAPDSRNIPLGDNAACTMRANFTTVVLRAAPTRNSSPLDASRAQATQAIIARYPGATPLDQSPFESILPPNAFRNRWAATFAIEGSDRVFIRIAQGDVGDWRYAMTFISRTRDAHEGDNLMADIYWAGTLSGAPGAADELRAAGIPVR